MLYLAFHCDGEEDDEVHDEDGPEDWHVEGIEARTDHAHDDGLPCTVPEFELWESAHEGAEFFVRLGG